MTITSIGIQSISGRTGTPLQTQPQEPANENERHEKSSASEAEAAPPAPPPGMGKLIDKSI